MTWNWIPRPNLLKRGLNGKLHDTPCKVCGEMTTNFPFGAALCWKHYSFGSLLGGSSIATVSTPANPMVGLPKSTSTEPLVGYRVWKLVRNADGAATGYLGSTYKSEYTWPPRRRLCRDSIDKAGIHAVKDISRLLTGVPNFSNPFETADSGLWQIYKADVAGEVYLWGEVTEAQLGYLAEFAYPKQLWVPEDTDPLIVMQLEENYGVPVSMRKEFKKHHPEKDVRQSYGISHGSIQFFSYNPIPSVSTLPPVICCSVCGWYHMSNSCSKCNTVNPAQNAGVQTAVSMQQTRLAASTSNALANARLDALSFGLSSPPLASCGLAGCPICNPVPTTSAIVPYTPPKSFAVCIGCGGPADTGIECTACYLKRTMGPQLPPNAP